MRKNILLHLKGEHSSHSHEHSHEHSHRVVDIYIPLELREVPDEYLDKVIYIMVCKGSTGEVVRAEISLSDTAQQGIYSIADQIDYQTQDPDKIGLFNMTKDYEYKMDERFFERKTEDGDLLFMIDGGACHK